MRVVSCYKKCLFASVWSFGNAIPYLARIGGRVALDAYFNPASWRAFTREEMLEFLDRDRSGRDHAKPKLKKEKGKKKKNQKRSLFREVERAPRNRMIVLQQSVSPFDAYTYLFARFGEPNGMMTLFAKDDSDNLFHWDYYLKAGEKNLQFTGATEEVHVHVDGEFSDAEWLEFIKGLKQDFGRVSKEKGKFAGTLEKWTVFPNQFLTIANRCSELYHEIDEALPNIEILIDTQFKADTLESKKSRDNHSRLMNALTGIPTELSVLTPVMFESFLGLVVSGMMKPEIEKDAKRRSEYVRGNLDEKLTKLAEVCNGFKKALTKDNPAFGRYWDVVNKRNDILHGNVDLVRDAVEVVYFHGKRPLYKQGGDRIAQHWRRLVEQYRPREVAEDYLATHDFIIEILNHMQPAYQHQMYVVMEDTQPGWDAKRRIFGRLFPNVVATAMFAGMFHDWQLVAPE